MSLFHKPLRHIKAVRTRHADRWSMLQHFDSFCMGSSLEIILVSNIISKFSVMHLKSIYSALKNQTWRMTSKDYLSCRGDGNTIRRRYKLFVGVWILLTPWAPRAVGVTVSHTSTPAATAVWVGVKGQLRLAVCLRPRVPVWVQESWTRCWIHTYKYKKQNKITKIHLQWEGKKKKGLDQ